MLLDREEKQVEKERERECDTYLVTSTVFIFPTMCIIIVQGVDCPEINVPRLMAIYVYIIFD